jgi:hypothetical protein
LINNTKRTARLRLRCFTRGYRYQITENKKSPVHRTGLKFLY